MFTAAAMSNARKPISALLIALSLFAAACGGSDVSTDASGDGETTVSGDEVTTTEADAEPETTTTAEPETTTTAEPTTTRPSEGEPLDFGPAEGQELAVIGVRFDDELNFRAGPGTDQDVIRSVAPLVETPIIVAAGEAWAFDTSIWWKVTIEGEEMWANQTFLGMLGEPTSIFAEVALTLEAGDGLEGSSVEAIAEAVAASRTSEEPLPSVEFPGEPLAFDTGEGFAIVDLVGFLDDAVLGERLRVEVEFEVGEDDGSDEPVVYRLTDVIATPICARGVSDGLCL